MTVEVVSLGDIIGDLNSRRGRVEGMKQQQDAPHRTNLIFLGEPAENEALQQTLRQEDWRPR